MVKRILFGNGTISRRLVFKDWWCRLEFKPQDLWIGAFWKTIGHCFDLWICIIPCVPIHVTILYHDPEQ